MRLGLVHINMGPMSQPDALVTAARAADGPGRTIETATEAVSGL